MDAIATYPENVAVTLSVPFLSEDGTALTPTTLAYRVLDETGTELQASQSLAVPGGSPTAVSVTVPGPVNVLPTYVPPTGLYDPATPVLRSMRVIELAMTTAAGVFTTNAYYIVAKNVTGQLQVLVNSFQTYETALLEVTQMPALDGWNAATRQDRAGALIESYFRLTKLGYRIPMNAWGDSPPAGFSLVIPSVQGDWVISPRLWPILNESSYDRYPDHFRLSMRRAQIAESNVILTGDPVDERRREGVMSESVGESSMMFRPGKPLDLPISKEACKYLQNYIEWRITTTRA